MSSTTEITNIAVKKFLFTVHDYHLMGEKGILPSDQRFELIHGEIIEMSPSKSYHAGVINDLIIIFGELLEKKWMLTVQNPIVLNDYNEPEPDLAIAKRRKDRYKKSHPKPEDILVLIEVADSTLEKDREMKLPLYASAGIPETWIINLQDQQIEVSTEPSEKGYANLHIYRKGDVIKHELIKELKVDEIFLEQ